MQNKRSYLWKAGVVVLCGGSVCVCYAVNSTYKTLDKLVQTKVMDYNTKRAEYIYLSEMKFHPMVSAEGGIPDDPLIVNAVINWWTQFKKSLAWRHFRLAQEEDKHVRLKAIRALANVSYVTDSDYRMLAQALDARTAIGLGRTPNADVRFFLPPPPSRRLTVSELKHTLLRFMTELESIGRHGCLSNFLSNRKKKEQAEANEVYAVIPEFDEEIVLKALDVVLHHSNVPGHGQGMLKLGILPILTEIYHTFDKNQDVRCKLFSLIANLTVDMDQLKDYFASGWIGILVQGSRSSDARQSLPCHKALANLDPEEHPHLDRWVYLLHPTYRTDVPSGADVIFVHGLLGAVHWTWRSGRLTDVEKQSAPQTSSERFRKSLKKNELMKEIEEMQHQVWKLHGRDFEFVLDDLPERAVRESTSVFTLPGKEEWVRDVFEREESTSCWARDWLPKDCPGIRVLGINYRSGLSQWLPHCPDGDSGLTLVERSQKLTTMLLEAGVGKRPIIWVTHSMGGLIVKTLLVQAFESGNPRLEDLCRNTKGITFLTVPHLGSEIADLGFAAEFLMMPSVEVQEMRFRSPALVSLHERFLQLMQKSPIRILSFAEAVPLFTRPLYKPQLIVAPYSADPGVGEFFEVPRNHIDMCKPSGRYSFIYRKIVEMVLNCSSRSSLNSE